MCIRDSAVSFYIECESEDELNAVFKKLADGGKALMPPDRYGFSRRFGWAQDKYGVSWQLNLS
ncbi:MAG: VOC family protein, partial [Alphaproteobacteria bacterium]|nr:VOC family protein [Alphaproteobacteria bacterium]